MFGFPRAQLFWGEMALHASVTKSSFWGNNTMVFHFGVFPNSHFPGELYLLKSVSLRMFVAGVVGEECLWACNAVWI